MVTIVQTETYGMVAGSLKKKTLVSVSYSHLVWNEAN